MKRKMMDILACPIDKSFPLELFELTTKDEIISEGVIFCSKCTRFYPIVEEIPIMLPDELREKNLDLEFLRKYKNALPEKIVIKGSPWHL